MCVPIPKVQMAYRSGGRWSIRCSSSDSLYSHSSRSSPTPSSASLGTPASPQSSPRSPAMASSFYRYNFAPVSPGLSPMLTSARRTSSLSALGTNLEDSSTDSQKSCTSGIRKSRNSEDSRARAIAIALHHAVAIGGASEGEDARRPFCSDARLGYRIADPARPLPMRADVSFTAVRSPLVPLALS